MPAPSEPLYAAIGNLKLPEETFDLGEGLTLKRRYSCVFACPMVAFSRPASPDQHAPGPWVSANPGYHLESDVELLIPPTFKHPKLGHAEVARVLVTLMRMKLDPRILLLTSAGKSMDELAAAKAGPVWASEVHHRWFQLGLTHSPMAAETLPWLRDRWKVAVDLFASSAAFRLGMETFELGQFVQSQAMVLVALWGALEALFSGEKAELSFRVSVYVASYLAPPGPERLALQNKVAKLYGKRSAAAHGLPKHEPDDLTESFALLRDALVAMIERGSIPTRDDLQRLLLGSNP